MDRDPSVSPDGANRDLREAGLSSLGGGANQAGGRAYNERLALSLIRLNGPLTRAELARLTGLTPQTLSHIVRRLEEDGLVVARAPQRGRVGQPSTPYALNPDGAFSFGIKIGRRSTDLFLCDFLGAIRTRTKRTHAYPDPAATLALIETEIARMRADLPPEARFSGVGIAMPFELWKWAEEVDAPAGLLDGWRDLDVAAEVAAATGLPTWLANDATAACGAELAQSPRGAGADWFYFFIGSFVGGGVVLNGTLYQGRSRNAGAIGSMPVFIDGKTSQLISHASVISLEKAMRAEGRDASLLQSPDADWSAIGPVLDRWIDRAARTLATAIVAATAIIDFQRICIDGAVPRDVLARLVAATRARIADLDLDGLSPFDVDPGDIGADARALGGAMLPMIANYSCDQEVLLKR